MSWPRGPYSDEDVAKIKRMWKSGEYSMRDIGDVMGQTRNVIAGIIGRGRVNEGDAEWPPRLTGNRQPRPKVVKSRPLPKPKPKPEIKKPKNKPIRWIDRQPLQCTYITRDVKEFKDITELRCCGAPVKDGKGSWCEYHYDMVWQSGWKRKRDVALPRTSISVR